MYNIPFDSAIVIILIILLTSVIVIHLIRDCEERDRRFKTQMLMAEAQTSMTNPLKFDEIRKIITDIVINIVSTTVAMNGYQEMKDDELSIKFDAILLEVASKTESYLSKELIRQWEKFATMEYRTDFIVYTARAALLLNLNRKRIPTTNIKSDEPTKSKSEHTV